MDEAAKAKTQQALTAALSTVLGAAIPGLPGEVAGAALVPVLEPFVAKAFGEFTRDSRASAGQVIADASASASMDGEAFVREICRDEHRLLLGGLAMTSGSRTRNREKIRALGRALADGVLSEDEARLDETHLFIRALDDLEAPHIAVLELLVAYVPGSPPRPYADVDTNKPDAPTRNWRISDLSSARPGLRIGFLGLLGTLQRHGLAGENQNTIGVLEEFSRAQERESRNSRPVSALRPRPSALPSGMSRVSPHWYPTELGEKLHQYLGTAQPDEPPPGVTNPSQASNSID